MYKLLYTLILGLVVFFGSFAITSAVNGLLTPGVVRQSGLVILPGVASSTIGNPDNLWEAGWFKTLYATNVSASSTSFTRSGGALDMSGYAISNAGAITGTTLSATSTTVASSIVYRLGIGTTTPAFALDVYNSGTSSVRVDTDSATKGGCIVVKDADGAGYTYITASNGVITASTDSCL